jgi:hypothetical protein
MMTITKPITRENLDNYLDGGVLYIAMTNGKWYRVRRNGKTKLWKSDASKFRLPIKYGFRHYGYLDESLVRDDGTFMDHLFRHHDDIESGKRAGG